MEITERLLRNEVRHLSEDLKALTHEFIFVQKFLKLEFGDKYIKYRATQHTEVEGWRNENDTSRPFVDTSMNGDIESRGPRIVASYSQSNQANDNSDEESTNKTKHQLKKHRLEENDTEKIEKITLNSGPRKSSRSIDNKSKKRMKYDDIYSDSEEERDVKNIPRQNGEDFNPMVYLKLETLKPGTASAQSSKRRPGRPPKVSSTLKNPTSTSKSDIAGTSVRKGAGFKPTARKSTGGILKKRRGRPGRPPKVKSEGSSSVTTAKKIHKIVKIKQRGSRMVVYSVKNRHPLWKYFEYKASTDRSHCLVPGCQKIMKHKYTTNLLKHLECNHNLIYLEVEEERAQRVYEHATSAAEENKNGRQDSSLRTSDVNDQHDEVDDKSPSFEQLECDGSEEEDDNDKQEFPDSIIIPDSPDIVDI